MIPFQEPFRIAQLLKDYQGRWMVAGGWAIDLYLNQETREHLDIEIAIPRTEQLALQNYLKSWKLNFIDDGVFCPWEKGVFLTLPLHEIHGQLENDRIEVLLNEMNDKNWFFRRNLKIQYPLSHCILESKTGLPILCPEIVLLYKAKSSRNKDKMDLLNSLPVMNTANKAWLKKSLKVCHDNHEWIDLISL